VDYEEPQVQRAADVGCADRRRHEPLLFLSSFVFAALMRAIPWQYVLTSEGVIFRDGDSYAHMWRIWNAASKSIPLSARDPFVNFPDGGEVLWSPAFDWILATLIRWLGLDQPAAELLCAWVPLILGATAVALAALIASRTFSPTAGWVTGLMLAVLPGSFLYTQLGYLDHHAAMTLIGTAMLGGAMRIVSVGGAGPRFWPIAAGGLCAFALLIWAGALLHVGVLQIAMLVWALTTTSRELAQARTIRVGVAHAIAAVVLLPFSLRVWAVFGDFNPLALTRFQPTWYGAGALCLASAALCWRLPSLGSTRRRRLVTAAVVGVVGLGLAFVTIPQLAAILDRSAGWFTSDVEFLSTITELTPLFAKGEQPSWLVPMQLLSPLLFVSPLALIAIGWRSTRPERWLLVFWTAAFCALSLNQSRFVNTFSVAYAIVWGGAIALLLDSTRQRISTPRIRFGASAIVATALAATVVVSSWPYYERRLRNGGDAVMDAKRPARRAIAYWLATTNPALLDEYGNPTSGLLCEWSGGHEIRYHSGWAIHQDGFGPYVSPENTELASRYYAASNEDEAIEILEQMGTRYVIADFLGAGQPPYARRSMTRRLVKLHGSGAIENVKRANQREWVPALTRHRLVFNAPHGRGGAWLYEVVSGADIVGSATPGELILVQLLLGTPSGPPFTWTTRQRVDETGEFRLRVPYATIDAPLSGFMPLGPYQLRTRRGVSEIDVTEAAIQDGATIIAPSIE
jgi:asparagine N-glycosylation enzyme membrane subunit Stt3